MKKEFTCPMTLLYNREEGVSDSEKVIKVPIMIGNIFIGVVYVSEVPWTLDRSIHSIVAVYEIGNKTYTDERTRKSNTNKTG